MRAGSSEESLGTEVPGGRELGKHSVSSSSGDCHSVWSTQNLTANKTVPCVSSQGVARSGSVPVMLKGENEFFQGLSFLGRHTRVQTPEMKKWGGNLLTA